MEAEEFWKRVSVRAALHNREQAKRVVDVVFDALRARISHGLGDNIAAQFPKEIREQWEHGTVEHIARSIGGFERMNLQEFLDRVGHDLRMAGVDSKSAVCAVFTTVKEQITQGAATKLEQELPEDMHEYWRSCLTAWDHEEMLSLPKENVVAGLYGSDEIGPSAVSVMRSDEQLKSIIEDLLHVNDEIDASHIDIEVHAGKVTLKGEVPSEDQRHIARDIAGEALGTTEVIDQLTIKASGEGEGI